VEVVVMAVSNTNTIDAVPTEYDLGNDIFLTLSTYNRDRVVNVRKFIMNDNGKYPTKTGVCFSLSRFVGLLEELENIDNAYNFVSMHIGEQRVVHIGGGLFASVSNAFKCINLRYFFKNKTGLILPSRQGIALPLLTWNALKVHAPQLKASSAEIITAERCNSGRFTHYGQESFYQCKECNPFYSEFETVKMPAVYNAMIDGIASLPPSLHTPVLMQQYQTPISPFYRESETEKMPAVYNATIAGITPLPPSPPTPVLLQQYQTPLSTTSYSVDINALAPAIPPKKRRVSLMRQLSFQ
jgi:hypothetical protein